MSTWAKISHVLGPEFDPYLPLVMPNILTTAGAKMHMSVQGTCSTLLYSLSSLQDDDEELTAEHEGWETVTVGGRTMGIKTSAKEETCQAFDTLLIYCLTPGCPCLSQTLKRYVYLVSSLIFMKVFVRLV
jgi:hypothetical protein